MNVATAIAIQIYKSLCDIFRVIEPKRQRMNAALSTLTQKQTQLQDAKDKLAEVRDGNFFVLLKYLAS